MDGFISTFIFGLSAAPLFAVLPAIAVVIYIIARLRDAKEETENDPQLGMKTALCFFQLLGTQLTLAGLALCTYGIVKSGDSADSVNWALALCIPGILVWVSHWLALRRTNRHRFPFVVRMFAGLNFIIAGLIGIWSLVFALGGTLQSASATDSVHIGWSLTVVYVPAWILGASLFATRYLRTTTKE